MKRNEIREMRALSIRQPWAHSILHFGKNIENRPKITHYRGTIAIHASQGMYEDDFDYVRREMGCRRLPDSSEIAAGAVVGFADIVDVVTQRTVTARMEKWFVGKYGYVLSNVITLKNPIEVTGALGFWRLKGKKLEACLDQLSASQIARLKPFEKAEL